MTGLIVSLIGHKEASDYIVHTRVWGLRRHVFPHSGSQTDVAIFADFLWLLDKSVLASEVLVEDLRERLIVFITVEAHRTACSELHSTGRIFSLAHTVRIDQHVSEERGDLPLACVIFAVAERCIALSTEGRELGDGSQEGLVRIDTVGVACPLIEGALG